MDYRRTYWLLFVGAGFLFGLGAGLDAAAGGLTAWSGLSLAVAALVVVVSGYAAVRPERAGGPEELGPRFAVALVAFLLLAWLVLERLVAG